jgi:hypothetical protein
MFLSPGIVFCIQFRRFLRPIFCLQNQRNWLPISSGKLPARIHRLTNPGELSDYGPSRAVKPSSTAKAQSFPVFESTHPICALPTTSIRSHRGLHLYLNATTLFRSFFRYVPRCLAPGYAPVCPPSCRPQGYSQQFCNFHDLHWPVKTWFRI